MAELDTIYIILGAQAIAMLVTTAVYYALRLRIESRKEQASRASLEAMVKYHSQRLDIETEKLEIARGNVSTQEVHVKEHSREARKTQEPEAETTIQKYIRVRDHVKPPEPMMSDEEFAARIKRIREMGQ